MGILMKPNLIDKTSPKWESDYRRGLNGYNKTKNSVHLLANYEMDIEILFTRLQ